MLLAKSLPLVMLVAVASADLTVVEVTNMRRESQVVLECQDETIPVRNRPTWLRNGLGLHMSPNFNASRITFNDGSANVNFLPALPEDEGRYQCKVDSETSQELPIQVPPYVPQKSIHTFHGLGTNFTLPCGVKIGDISRQRHHRVEWLLYMVPPASGAPHSQLFRYDSRRDGNSTMEFNGQYQFNPSNQNFSLHVTDFAVDRNSLRQHVVYYECIVGTFIQGSYFANSSTTNVTFEFENATILTPLPPLLVVRPGENATIDFVFGGFPNPTVEWRLGSKVLTGPKYAAELQRSGDSDNVTRAQLTVVGLDERDTGLLTAAVQVCMFNITTSTKIVTIPQITNVKVLTSTPNDTPCGTQDLRLTFSLPMRIPVHSLQLRVNFSEVLDPGGDARRGRTTVRTYPAQAIFNTTQVRFPIPQNVAQAVEGYPRFSLQAKLIVNGTEGQTWSEFSPTIQTRCTSMTETATLQLGVQFNGGTCFSVKRNDGFQNEFSAAIQGQFHRHCTFQCEQLTVERPGLECSSDTLGTFGAVVSAYAARALVQQFYELVEEEGVTFTPTNGTSVTLCVDCIPVEGPSVLLICVLGMAGIVVFLVVLIAILIVVAIKKRHNSKSEDTEVGSMPNVDDRPPAPLPRPIETLEVPLHDVRVTRAHTSSHHSETRTGGLRQEMTSYENLKLMPLSEAGEIADEQLFLSPNYTASEGTGSEAYIRDVETVPAKQLLPRMSDTLPRDDFYMTPIATSTSPPVTHHSPHSIPHHTPPTSPKMQVATSRGTSHHSTMLPPAADVCSPKCPQSTPPLAVYPSVSPGYVTHTPPTSPTCTIATMAHTEPTHFLFPPKRGVLTKTGIHGNHCASCGLPLGSASDSRIVRPGYIPHSNALSHRSTGELKSRNLTIQHRSPACHKCLKLTREGRSGSCPGHDQPCSNLRNERCRHASFPLEDHTASKEKLGMPCKCREQYSMHSLDLRTTRESCNRFPSIPARMQTYVNVVQDKENCLPITSDEITSHGPTKCSGMQDGYNVSGDSTISDSNKAVVPNCPEGYLPQYPPSSRRVGRIASEKDHKRNGYVRQTIPAGHPHQMQTFATESSESKPTVQLPDNVVEGNGEPFRTQLWLLGDEEDSDIPE